MNHEDMRLVAIHILTQHFSYYIDFHCDKLRSCHKPDYKKIFNYSAQEWCDFLLHMCDDSYKCMFSKILRSNQDKLMMLSHLIHQSLQEVQQADLNYMIYSDRDYPPSLRQIQDAPAGFSFYGCVSLFKRACIAIIGSRKASEKALAMSAELGYSLAKYDYSIVSGGAYGCDISAHRGVLNHMYMPAPIIVVMASGLSNLYPRGNHATFTHILAAGGVILSERLWSAGCRRVDFPIRNRLVSGLAQHVLVIEAGERSGAMITARQALDQGREVWVYHGPSKYGDIRACGNRALISEGAPYFEGSHELIDTLGKSSLH